MGSNRVDSLRRRSFQHSVEDSRGRQLAGSLVLLAVAAPFVARVLINARIAPGAYLATQMELLTTVAIVGPALGAGVFAATTDVEAERVGLAFVGAFGLLAAVSPAATTPAAAAVVAGGALAVGARWQAVSARTVDWRLLPVVAIFGATVLSLGAALDIFPGGGRVVGAHLALLGAAATPALVSHRHSDWALGGAVAGFLVAVGLVAPFLTGAVVLVAGGIVTVSLPVLAAGLAGIVTTASAGVRSGQLLPVAGAALLLAAGVPTMLPSALAGMLGLLMLVDSPGGVAA
jgi:hypothetical protein